MDPAAVGAAEDALRRAGVADPALEVRRSRRARRAARPTAWWRARPGAATSRTRWPRPVSARATRSAALIAERGEVAGGQAGPRHAGEQRARRAARRPSSRRARRGRGRQAGRRPGGPMRAAGHAAALPLVPGARRDERVEPRAVGVRAVVAVGGDRAVHEARVERAERVVVDPELAWSRRGRSSRCTTSASRASARKPVVVGRRRGGRAPRCACPGATPARPRTTRERVAAGRLDLGDVGAVVGEQHAGHRTGDAGREVEDVDALQDSAHACPLSSPA